jgi:hypothetical protein
VNEDNKIAIHIIDKCMAISTDSVDGETLKQMLDRVNEQTPLLIGSDYEYYAYAGKRVFPDDVLVFEDKPMLIAVKKLKGD